MPAWYDACFYYFWLSNLLKNIQFIFYFGLSQHAAYLQTALIMVVTMVHAS